MSFGGWGRRSAIYIISREYIHEYNILLNVLKTFYNPSAEIALTL
jgi:hypothetical protein